MAMAYKLIEAARARRRAVNAPHLVTPIRAGALFHEGTPIERPVDITPRTVPGYTCARGRLTTLDPQDLTVESTKSTQVANPCRPRRGRW